MSRVGSAPILIPPQVTLNIEGQMVVAKGPLGELEIRFRPEIKVEVEDTASGKRIIVKRKKEDRVSRSLHGLTRSLIANMVSGVEKGWQKKLELVGVGYRAQAADNKLTLSVGFSHPVEVVAPPGVKFTVSDNTKIEVSGIDKQLVGETAASIRRIKPPEPYQGKGIRYSGEYIRRKAGKAGKVGVGTK